MKLFHQLLRSWIFLKYNPCCATHSSTTSATGEWSRSCFARPFLSWPALCLAPTRTVEFSPRSTASHCTENKFCAFRQLIHLKLSEVIWSYLKLSEVIWSNYTIENSLAVKRHPCPSSVCGINTDHDAFSRHSLDPLALHTWVCLIIVYP